MIDISKNDTNEREFRYQSGSTLPWHLDRLDHGTLPLDQSYRYKYDGTGVYIYFIDTGIRITHNEFRIRLRDQKQTTSSYLQSNNPQQQQQQQQEEQTNQKMQDEHDSLGSRAQCGLDLMTDSIEPCDDIHGHGTHVAGVAGGLTYGVAKNATLVALKVFDSKGHSTSAAFIAAIDYVVGMKIQYPSRPIIISASLGGDRIEEENNIVTKAINEYGIHFVAAAGNESNNACQSSPASVMEAITVGATTLGLWRASRISSSSSTSSASSSTMVVVDQRASYSNYGTCVDLFAPGTNITSSFNGNDNATTALSGTSQATPLVAGIIALYLEKEPLLQPNDMKRILTATLSSSSSSSPTNSVQNVDDDSMNSSKQIVVTNGTGTIRDQIYWFFPRKSPNLFITTQNLV